jgi:uncharacterized membrane protein YraQ (UPF0718 family)
MVSFIDLFERTFAQVVLSLLHNWPYLLASMAIAVALKHAVDARRLSTFLSRHRRAGVVIATAAAVGTPFCSCGTTAVVLGMMASTMPWAPIVAFMVASPLTSPEGMVYTAGLFGWPFAIAMFAASIALGLGGGLAASLLERRGLLGGQARLAPPRASACSCATVSRPVPTKQLLPMHQPVLQSVGCAETCAAEMRQEPVITSASARAVPDRIVGAAKDFLATGGRLLAMFLGFAFVGYLLNNLVPAAWIAALFGSGKVYGVPLAATLGLPLYVSSEASLPLVRALLDSGMSQGAVMAFLIAGSGTSIGAIVGALTIARWRVVALVVGVLWVGAIAAGFGYNLLLASKLFA